MAGECIQVFFSNRYYDQNIHQTYRIGCHWCASIYRSKGILNVCSCQLSSLFNGGIIKKEDTIRCFRFVLKIPRFTSWSSKWSCRLNFDSLFFNIAWKSRCRVTHHRSFFVRFMAQKQILTHKQIFIILLRSSSFFSLLLYTHIRIYMCRERCRPLKMENCSFWWNAWNLLSTACLWRGYDE